MTTATLDDSFRLILQHTGRNKLPREVVRAIRAVTKAWPDNPAVWVASARCLRYTWRTGWAWKCYKRARKLNHGDLDLAEEVGMFAVRDLPTPQSKRLGLAHLLAARADPQRRERIDPVLFHFARPFPALFTMLFAIGAFIGMASGESLSQRGVDGGVIVWSLAGIGVMLLIAFAFVGVFWLLIRPHRQVGWELLRRAFWPPRVVHAITEVVAIVTLGAAGYTVVLAALEGFTDAMNTMAGPMVLLAGLTFVLSLFGLPREVSLKAVLDIAKEFAGR